MRHLLSFVLCSREQQRETDKFSVPKNYEFNQARHRIRLGGSGSPKSKDKTHSSKRRFRCRDTRNDGSDETARSVLKEHNWNPEGCMPCGKMAYRGLTLKTAPGAYSDTQQPFWRPEQYKYEDYKRYCKGGYCPITLHQELNTRYTIRYKLGFGQTATVWLAIDCLEKRHVALKVLTADRSAAAASEADLLDKVAERDHNLCYVINILDQFRIHSDNGSHRVLVMPVTRSASSLSSSSVPFRSVVKSLVKGLDGIHSAGIVHGGK